MLLRLSRAVLHDESPELVWDKPFDEMEPRLCLAGLNAWAELIYLVKTPRHDIFHDYMEVRNVAFRIAHVIQKHPYFMLPRLLSWLARQQLPSLDEPLVQNLLPGFAAAIKGEERFTIPPLEGRALNYLPELERRRKELMALYTSGQRAPSAFLATWDSFM